MATTVARNARREVIRDCISAKFLLTPVPGKRDVVVIPDTVKITVLPAKVASGARKPRLSGTGAAKSTTVVAGMADRSVLLPYASRGIAR